MTFDTFTYAEGLKNSGIPDEHVRALTQELTKALKSEDLATKQDMKDLAMATKRDITATKQAIRVLAAATKQDMKDFAAATKQNVENLAIATKQDIASVRQEIRDLAAMTKQDVAELKTDMSRWVIGMLVAQTGIIIAAIKLF